jgi:hypothetical protein
MTVDEMPSTPVNVVAAWDREAVKASDEAISRYLSGKRIRRLLEDPSSWLTVHV